MAKNMSDGKLCMKTSRGWNICHGLSRLWQISLHFFKNSL